MPPFSQHGPVDFLMSVAPPSHYPILTSAPSMDDTLSPSSTQSPSSSPQHPSSSPAPSLDSPSSLAAFLHRLREAASSPTRLLEASKLANVEDDDVKQSFIEQGGVALLLDWLQPSSVNSHHVILQTLDALSILPLASTTASYPTEKLQSRLRALTEHANQSVRQAAEELSNSLRLQAEDDKRTAEEEEEEAAEGASSESKFHLIKIDKSTTEPHEHAVVNGHTVELPSPDAADKQAVSFDAAPPSPPLSPVAKSEAELTAVSEDKEKQRSMAEKIEAEEESKVIGEPSSEERPSNKKRKRLSVRWVEDEKLEDVKLFFKDELIARKEKKAAAAEVAEDKSAIDWYTPPPLTAPPSQHAVGIVPVSSEERAGRRQAAFPGAKPNGGEAPASQNGATQGDLFSQLNSLASMLSSSTSASSSTLSAPITSAPSSATTAPAPASAPASNNLSALLSNLSALTAGTGASPAPTSAYTSASLPPFSAPAPAPAGGTSRLLSLLSNSSALSGLTASLSGTSQQPAQPQPQPQYPPQQAQHPYHPPPPPPTANPAPQPSSYPAQPHYASYPPPPPPAAVVPPPTYRAPLLPPPTQSPYYGAPPAPAAGYPHNQPPPLLPTPPPHVQQYQPPPPSAYPPRPSYPPPPPAAHYPPTAPAPGAYAPAGAYPPTPASSPYAPPPAAHYPPAASPYQPAPPAAFDPYAQQRAEYERYMASQQQPPPPQQQQRPTKRKRMDERPVGVLGGAEVQPDMSKFKTRPCAAWSAGKPCRYGDKCTFIHDGPPRY